MKPTSITHSYSQDEDCCGRFGYHVQTLDATTEDGGGGPYVVIRTERFALDEESIDEFAAALKGMIGRTARVFDGPDPSPAPPLGACSPPCRCPI